MNNKFDFVIIVAGVVGLAIAERLSRKFKNILLVEKESKFGQHTSSRNSEVIHSGFYYSPNTLKAQLCVEGNPMIYAFCNKYNIPYKRCGKLVVANNEEEEMKLQDILSNATKNGLEDIRIISNKEALVIEPNVKCSKALWVPSTGIMDSHLIMSKLENLSLSRDVSIAYNLEVNNIEKKNNYFTISFKQDDIDINANSIINCAGLWSHKISNKFFNTKYEIEYYKGDYYKTHQLKDMNCLIYPIPQQISLGIHAILNLNGEDIFGPNAYKVNKINYSTSNQYKKIFLQEANKLINQKIDQLDIDYSGIRPKIKFNGQMNDFIIKEEPKVENFYNLIGIDSPGLTSSLAIAKYLQSIIQNN